MSAPAAQTTPVRAAPARAVLLITAGALLVVLCVVSLAAGSKAIPLDEVWRAVFDRTAAQVANPQVDAIVWGVRLPRTICAVLVGLALGLAGALMQGLTRNPLADPGLLGVSAGASFAIVVAVAGLGVTAAAGYGLVRAGRGPDRGRRRPGAGQPGAGRRHPGQDRSGRHRADVPARLVHQRHRAAAPRGAEPVPVLVGRIPHRRRPGPAVADGARSWPSGSRSR